MMKFSIVTPVYGGERFIAETIESVLSQEGDFEIEYTIADGGSSDRTMAIVQAFVEKLESNAFPVRCKKATLRYFSEKDRGMYDAVEKGFAHSTGMIMAYINSDDRYMPGAFASAAAVFDSYPDIVWIKGRNNVCNEAGEILSRGPCRTYRRDWLMKGVYGRSAYFVDQESVFWKRSLWESTHPKIAHFRLAGDYALWVIFSRHAPLQSFNRAVSIFRRHPEQLSSSMKAYREEQSIIAPKDIFLEKRVTFFFSLLRALSMNPDGLIARMICAVFFPCSEKEWYIDFNVHGKPIKRMATSFLIHN